MAVVLVSVLLSLAALAGMSLTILQGSLMTVDGLFFTLIMGVLSAIFGLNALYELRAWRVRTRQQATARVAVAGAVASRASSPASDVKSPLLRADTLAPAKPISQRIRRSSREALCTIDGLRQGTVLVKHGAPLPETLQMRSGSVSATRFASSRGEWEIVECSNAASLERPLHEAGWEIFYLVGKLAGDSWALNQKQALNDALRPVFAAVEAQGRNAVEIAHIRSRKLLGLHHVSVVAYARHLQPTPFVLEPAGKSQRVFAMRKTTTAADMGHTKAA